MIIDIADVRNLTPKPGGGKAKKQHDIVEFPRVMQVLLAAPSASKSGYIIKTKNRRIFCRSVLEAANLLHLLPNSTQLPLPSPTWAANQKHSL